MIEEAIRELQGSSVAVNLALIGLVVCLNESGVFDGSILAEAVRKSADKADNPTTKEALLVLADGFEGKPFPPPAV